MKKVFVVSYIYQEYGGRAVHRVSGVADTMNNAIATLDKTLKHILETLSLDKVDDECSIVQSNYFMITNGNNDYFAEGFIDEREVGSLYLKD